MVRVAYKQEEQLDAARSCVDSLAQVAARLADGVDPVEYWLRALPYAVLYLIVCCKDAAFCEEAEWRFVRIGCPTPRFRATPRMIVPYVEMSFSPNKDVVKELVLGPTLAPEVVEHSLKVFLENTGYGHVAVRRSRIPLRSL